MRKFFFSTNLRSQNVKPDTWGKWLIVCFCILLSLSTPELLCPCFYKLFIQAEKSEKPYFELMKGLTVKIRVYQYFIMKNLLGCHQRVGTASGTSLAKCAHTGAVKHQQLLGFAPPLLTANTTGPGFLSWFKKRILTQLQKALKFRHIQLSTENNLYDISFS